MRLLDHFVRLLDHFVNLTEQIAEKACKHHYCSGVDGVLGDYSGKLLKSCFRPTDEPQDGKVDAFGMVGCGCEVREWTSLKPEGLVEDFLELDVDQVISSEGLGLVWEPELKVDKSRFWVLSELAPSMGRRKQRAC